MIAIMQDKGITLRQVTHVVCDRLSAFPCPPCLNDCRHQNPFELEGQILIVTCYKYRPGLHVATPHTEDKIKGTVSLAYNENNIQREQSSWGAFC